MLLNAQLFHIVGSLILLTACSTCVWHSTLKASVEYNTCGSRPYLTCLNISARIRYHWSPAGRLTWRSRTTSWPLRQRLQPTLHPVWRRRRRLQQQLHVPMMLILVRLTPVQAACRLPPPEQLAAPSPTVVPLELAPSRWKTLFCRMRRPAARLKTRTRLSDVLLLL